MAIRCLNEGHGDNFTAFNADSCDLLPQLPAESIDLSVFSLPFANLFCYSDSDADMGNCANEEEFFKHYGYIVRELMRVTKPGRLCAVHCSDLPFQKWRDGLIGVNPFSDAVSTAHRKEGWIMACRVTVWKSPVVEMTRTKALGLLYKQLQKDSTRSRMGMPDYLFFFRKPGDSAEPVGHKPADFPVEQWQQWASPVWMDINQTNTLNVSVARESKDERHLCPLQLDIIERCIIMYSNPGDVVLSPFMGIGSEGFVALKNRRKFLGVELKTSYWRTGCKNLDAAERNAPTLLDCLEV